MVERGSQYPVQKKGYRRPAKFLYKDEGYPKDAFVAKVADCLQSSGYELNATRYLHSFKKDDEFLLKVDLRRKNSILVYIQDDLATMLLDHGIRCRGLYDSEIPNYPKHLCWAIKLETHMSVDRLISCMGECYKMIEK